MTDAPIYSSIPQPMSGPINSPAPPSPLNEQPMLANDVQAMIDAAVNAAESKYAARVQSLEDQLEAARATSPVPGPVATHAAGPGDAVAPSWGLWHQEMSRAGNLTREVLTAVGIHDKAE